MTNERNREIVREMVEQGMGGGDVDRAVAAYAPDFVYHNPVLDEMPALPRGPEVVQILVGATRAAFPDMIFTIESLVAEGDRVALLYSWRGTHLGSMADITATGRMVHATGAIFCRLAGGKIVEQWDVDDRFAVMQQLGLFPMPQQTGA
jgi:predicted SnoaL-like aldol condensation-catalyzing enzyme